MITYVYNNIYSVKLIEMVEKSKSSKFIHPQIYVPFHTTSRPHTFIIFCMRREPCQKLLPKFFRVFPEYFIYSFTPLGTQNHISVPPYRNAQMDRHTDKITPLVDPLAVVPSKYHPGMTGI